MPDLPLLPDEPAPEDWTRHLFDTVYAGYNERDTAALEGCYAPDLRVTINGRPGPGDRRAFLEGLREQWLGFPDIVATETGRVVSGSRVVTEMTIAGHNSAPFLGRPATGKRWQASLVWVCEVEQGAVASIRVYVDNRSIQEAVRRD